MAKKARKSAGHRQAERVCRVINIPPERAAFDTHAAFRGIDVDPAHL